MSLRLLLVEDDDAIAAPLERALAREKYDVQRVATGGEALAALADPRPIHLMLLDLGLPDMDGLDVCRQARSTGFCGGIMILTARGGELDRVVGLDVGADDYLAKPFSLAELLARARALLRRTSEAAPPAVNASAVAEAVHPAGLRVDSATRQVWVDDQEVHLTAKEFDVLALLDDARGHVVTREDLMSKVWDEHWFGSTKTLDTTVGRLRSKLHDASAPATLHTVRGVGFRLEDDADHA